MNPRRRSAVRGPKRLGNLPPALRAYWRRVRAGARRKNPRRASRRGKTVTTVSRSVRRTNPRGRSMAHRHGLTAHQRRVRAARKAARTRRRLYGHSGRRRRRAVAHGINPRRHTRRARMRHRINPRRRASGGGRSFGVRSIGRNFVLPMGIGAAGAVGLDYIWQYASGYLPAQFTTGYIGTATKALTAVGAGWLASKVVSKQTAAIATTGALVVIGYQLLHQLIAQAAPQAAIASTTTAATPAVTGTAGYMLRGPLGWTSPAPLLRGLGRGPAMPFGAYSPAQRPAFAPAQAPMTVRPGGTVSMSGLASAGTW